MANNEDQKHDKNISSNPPSVAMESKRDVENSNDEKINQDFHGYPHLPAKEGNMGKQTSNHKVDAEQQQMGTGANTSGVNQRYLAGQDSQKVENAMTPQPGVGNDDLQNDLDAPPVRNDEIGVPHNVSNEELKNKESLPGTDMNEAGKS